MSHSNVSTSATKWVIGFVGDDQNYQMGWQDTKVWEKWEVNYDDYRPSSLAKLAYNYVGYNSSVWYYITCNYILMGL